MDFTILEEVVLYNAITKYLEFCEKALKNSENQNQLTFIRGDIAICNSLQNRIKADYISKGGSPDYL